MRALNAFLCHSYIRSKDNKNKSWEAKMIPKLRPVKGCFSSGLIANAVHSKKQKKGAVVKMLWLM